jgi:predicted NUDIX family NTP pyrophosphohydrolase
MKKQSAGLLVYRMNQARPEVLIAHMGGPWFAKKDKGAWSIPKGEYGTGEDPKKVAHREFSEELSRPVPPGEWIELGTIEQKNNKTVIAWALEGDLDASGTQSNTFTIEWPPHSGQTQEFPEIDRAGWFNFETASEKLIAAQVEFLKRLADKLEVPFVEPSTPEQSSLF